MAKFIAKHFYFELIAIFVFTVMLPLSAQASGIPELIYYKFNNAGGNTVQNEASAPVGTNPAPVLNLTIGGAGEFGSALIGSGGVSSADYVNTGWTVNLSPGSWTISLWLNNIPNNTSLYYIFGDATAGSFRCFLGGVAGAGNIILRGGGLLDIIIPGVASSQPSVVHFVYDSANSKILGYLNGAPVSTVDDPAVNVVGTTGPFKVGGYSISNGIPNGSLLDEFRVYNRALSANEIADTWNKELPTPEPEINLKQGVTDIADGGTYNFGNQYLGTNTDVTFTIENTGITENLTLTTPITIGGADAGEFSVQQQPVSPVASSGTTTFIVRFSPTSTGAKTASISIANNDTDENPYDLIITGTGRNIPTVPAMNEWGMIILFLLIAGMVKNRWARGPVGKGDDHK